MFDVLKKCKSYVFSKNWSTHSCGAEALNYLEHKRLFLLNNFILSHLWKIPQWRVRVWFKEHKKGKTPNWEALASMNQPNFLLWQLKPWLLIRPVWCSLSVFNSLCLVFPSLLSPSLFPDSESPLLSGLIKGLHWNEENKRGWRWSVQALVAPWHYDKPSKTRLAGTLRSLSILSFWQGIKTLSKRCD